MFDQIEAGIESARQSCSNIILAGDFNVHNEDWLGSSHTTIAGETAEDMCYQQHLQQYVNDATRGHNILDLVMSDIPNHVTTLLHPPLGRSHHAVITADFQLTPSYDQPSTRTVWRYQHADWPRLRGFFRKMDWDTILSDNPDSACELIAQKIIDGMNKFIPSKVLRTVPTDPVWWTPECSAAVEAKRKSWNLHRRNRDNVVLQDAYNFTCTATANCLTRTQVLHMQQIRRKLLSGSMRDREWWSTVKRAGGHGRQSTIPVLVDKSGQEHTRSCDKAEVLGQYFAEKCSLERDFDSCTPTFPNVR